MPNQLNINAICKQEIRNFVALFTVQTYFDFLLEQTEDVDHSIKTAIQILHEMYEAGECTNEQYDNFKESINHCNEHRNDDISCGITHHLVSVASKMMNDLSPRDRRVIGISPNAVKLCKNIIDRIMTAFYQEVININNELLEKYPFDDAFSQTHIQ